MSNGNPRNKAIWVDGGIHAREWISPASVTYILNNLVEEWDDQPNYIKDINWYEHRTSSHPFNQNFDSFETKKPIDSQVLPAAGQSRWLRILAHNRPLVAQKSQQQRLHPMCWRRFESKLWLPIWRRGHIECALLGNLSRIGCILRARNDGP